MGRGRKALPAVLGVLLIAGPSPALAGTPETPEHALVHWVNVYREQHGGRAMAASADLTAVAHRHSGVMQAAGALSQDVHLAAEVHGWRKVGADVGRGVSLGAIEKAFVADKANRASLLSPDFRQIGVGIKVTGGLLYVTVVLRQPA